MLGIFGFAISGCTQTAPLSSSQQMTGSGQNAGAQAAQSTFPDIPIPDGAKMNVEKTLVVGVENWFGQLSLQSSHAPNVLFDFYRNRLPQFQWREITSVRAPTSVLTYDRDNRVLQMQIRAATLQGSEITITVSPRGTDPGTQKIN